MLKRLHIRTLLLCLMLLVSMAAMAQRSQVTDRLAKNGQVKVDAPKELVKRNNADLNGKQSNNKSKTKKKVEPKEDEEKMNELEDDNKDKDNKKDEDKKKEEEKKEKKKDEISTPKKPKLNRTTEQTIEKRSVGYRIQAYTDNNSKTAKAAAQKRAREIAMKFPQYRSYISYKAPSWRLRIGDFKSRQDAQSALSRIKRVYPNLAREMVIVRDHINVWSND